MAQTQDLARLQEQAAEARRALEAAEAAQREAERQEREAKELAKRLEAVARVRAKLTPIAEGIVTALKAVGYEKASYHYDGEYATVPDIKINDGGREMLEFSEVYGDTWSTRGTGRYIVRVRNYPDTKNYPAKKDGSYNYPAIAETVTEFRKREEDRNIQNNFETKRNAVNDALAEKLNLQFTGRDWDMRIRPTHEYGDGKTGKVEIKLNYILDEAQAVKLVTALKALGFYK